MRENKTSYQQQPGKTIISEQRKNDYNKEERARQSKAKQLNNEPERLKQQANGEIIIQRNTIALAPHRKDINCAGEKPITYDTRRLPKKTTSNQHEKA